MEIITDTDCKKILRNHSHNSKALIDFEIGRFSENALGFLGDHYRLWIHYENENGEKDKLSFFVKCLPQSNQGMKDYLEEMLVFRKETMIYQNILPKLTDIVGLQFSPVCYLVKPDSCIVLEDLIQQGYRTEKFLTTELCLLALKTLAIFHSSSIILEERMADERECYRLIDHFKEELQEATFSFIPGHVRNKWLRNVTKAVADCIQLLPQYQNQNNIISNLWNFVETKLAEYLRPSSRFRNVIMHDDLWHNNIMFKPENSCVKIIDFQLSRYVPPAYEVLNFLYLNMSSHVLSDYLQYFLETYYTHFASNLIKNDVCPSTIMSKNGFEESLKFYRLPALLEAVINGTNVYVSNKLANLIVSDEATFNEFAFTNRSKHVTKEFKENSEFRERLTDTLIPLIQCLQN